MGLFDAAGNIVGAGISAGASSRQAEKQRQHDIDMAGLNQQNILAQMATSQEYNKENMAIQNQYQIDQWNRENLYNDPSAVAARYRKAGINPRAAFGNGSASGAGIAGGLSSAPSGSSPSGSTTGSSSTLYHSNPLAGLSHLGTDFGNALRAQRSIDADVAQKNAQTGEQLIENEYKEQNLVSDLILKRGEYEKLMADKSLSDTQRDHYKKLIEGIDQQIAESMERTKGYEGQRKNVEAQTKNTNASTSQIKEETRTAKLNNDLFEQTGVRPGMNVEQALISIGSKLFDLGKTDISAFLKKFGISPNAPITENQVKDAAQILADEYDRLDSGSRTSDKDAYHRYKMRLMHNLAITFK